MIWPASPQLIPEENTKVSINFPLICSHGEIQDVTLLIVIINFYGFLLRFNKILHRAGDLLLIFRKTEKSCEEESWENT